MEKCETEKLLCIEMRESHVVVVLDIAIAVGSMFRGVMRVMKELILELALFVTVL